jgi:hypothetical protein
MSENYPRGKLCNDDEGELVLRICVQDKTVILDFGKPVKWLGFSKQDALNLAETLIKRANEI